MTQVATVYAQALYSLARDEGCAEAVLAQLTVLGQSFAQEPDFVRLLSAPNLSKEERCRILDDSFRGKLNPYVLNFMKILTEKGYMRHFAECCKAFRQAYNQDHGILEVCAVTAVPLTGEQIVRLTEKLGKVTGKTVDLTNRVDAACLGGVRLDYDGKQVDDTVSHRLESIAALLKNTVL
jgi:F-type H+-transporting ATPase subunit delta